MIRVKVKPDYDDITGLYGSSDEWKEWVCEDFDENVVIIGRNGLDSIEEASWWSEVLDVIDAISYVYGEDTDYAVSYYFDNYAADTTTEAQFAACLKLADDASNLDSVEFMAEVAEILNPKLSFSYGHITGSVQGEEADVIYIDGSIDLQYLEDMYFGNLYIVDVYRVIPEDDENMEYEEHIGSTTITYTAYWAMSNREIEEMVRNCCYDSIDDDEEIEIED